MGEKREIQVLVDKDKLQDRNISVLQIADKIRNTSKDVPIGKVEASLEETQMRASGEIESWESLRKVNVNFFGLDRAVNLESVAEVKEGLEDQLSIASLMTRSQNFERRPTVYIDIFKQSGANTVRTC